MIGLFVLLLTLEDPTVPAPELGLPISGLKAETLRDSFDSKRAGYRRHEAIDIMSPRGTPIRAVASGTIRKLTRSKAGGITIYQFDETEQHCFYYAHLSRYASELREGMRVERGDVIGYVGSTGNATTPHLHFTFFEVGPEKRYWTGRVINPYPVLVDAAKMAELPVVPSAEPPPVDLKLQLY